MHTVELCRTTRIDFPISLPRYLHLQPDDTVLIVRIENSTVRIRYRGDNYSRHSLDRVNRGLKMRITRQVLLSIDATNATVATLNAVSANVTML